MKNYTVKITQKNGRPRTVVGVKAKNCYDACTRTIKSIPYAERSKGDRFIAMSPGGGRSYAITLAH